MRLVDKVNALAGRMGYYIGRLPPAADSLMTHVRSVLRHFAVDCVIDVGAHYGEFALALRRSGYQGQMISFEPVGESFERISQVASHDPSWQVFRTALGDRDGDLEISVLRATQLSSFLEPSADGVSALGDKMSAQRQERVEMRRLESLAQAALLNGPWTRVFLKLDTQGYNLNVIRGAGSFLDRVVACQCEMAFRPLYEGGTSWQEDLLAFRELGFVPSGMFPVVVDRQFRLIELDCVLVRDAPQGA